MSVPNVSENVASDLDLQLWLCKPNAGAASSYEYRIVDAFNINVTYNDGSAHNALTFSTFKDDHFVKQLSTDGWNWEVVVRWWDPRRGELVEPPNGRFVFTNSKEDMTDQSNRIDYTLIGKTWLLEKVRVRVEEKFNTAFRLNRDYDRAKAAFEEAERDYNSVLRQFESVGRQIQEDIWPGISHGPLFAVRGVAWLARDGKARWRSLVSNHAFNGEVWWYSRDRGKFVKLNMNTGSTTLQNRKQNFRSLGPQVYNARLRMNRARSAYAAAERAARESSRNGTRFFYNRTPGRVLTTLWREGQERDAGYLNHGEGTPTWPDSPYPLYNRLLKRIWRGFTATRDARGRLWTETTPRQNWEVRLGQSWWSVLQDFRERGLIDWRMGGPTEGGGGRSLYLVPYGSLEVDQTRRVALRLDVNVTEAPESVDGTEHQTVTFVQDSTGLNRYTYWNRNNPDNQTPWGLWEGAMTEAGADSLSTSLNMTLDKRRELSNRYAIDASRTVTVDAGQPIPMLDYEPHHLISVFDHENAQSARRVSQIIVSKPDAESPITAVVRLGTRRTNQAVSYARTMSKVLGEADVVQGHIPIDPALVPSQIPQDAMTAPAITSMGAGIRFNEEGRPRAVITAQVSAGDIPEPDDAERFDDSPQADDLIDDEEYEGD